ncbi:MAG: hypothetical protein ACE5Z5_02675 [Candidatus Bathyarchaeia archaeon]
MVKVTLVIQQPEINRFLKDELRLALDDGASVIDIIKAADEHIIKRLGRFPVKGYKSLLHMTYHPIEERFYRQTAVHAYTRPGAFLNVRENPKMPLPDDVKIIIVPEGGCMSDEEEVVNL